MKKIGWIMRGIFDVILTLIAMAIFAVAFIVTLPAILVGWVVIVPLLSIVAKLDKNEIPLIQTIINSTKSYLSAIIKNLENIVEKIGS